MIKRFMLFSFMSIAISGCATMTPEKAASWDTQKLCDTLSISRQYTDIENNPNAQMIIAELKIRDEFSQKEMTSILKSTIYLGMNQNALYCSWGTPKDRNSSTGSWGTHIQHVYNGGNYVYTENGKVTSWQN